MLPFIYKIFSRLADVNVRTLDAFFDEVRRAQPKQVIICGVISLGALSQTARGDMVLSAPREKFGQVRYRENLFDSPIPSVDDRAIARFYQMIAERVVSMRPMLFPADAEFEYIAAPGERIDLTVDKRAQLTILANRP